MPNDSFCIKMGIGNPDLLKKLSAWCPHARAFVNRDDLYEAVCVSDLIVGFIKSDRLFRNVPCVLIWEIVESAGAT